MGGSATRRLRAISGLGLAFLGLQMGLLSPAAGAAAFEPNESAAQAYGPLLAGQTYEADLPPADRDFFFFYVTGAEPAPTELTLFNQGGGTEESTINLAVVDGVETTISSQPYIRHGETRTLRIALAPGKYYLEVTSNQGYGDTYRITAGTGSGTFGPYSAITAHCDGARTALAGARAGLSKAQGAYQRAVARRRRSRFAGARARGRARRAQAKARSRLRLARRRLASARADLDPWCSVPQ